MKRLYYNTSDSSVVVDEEGRTLGGREFGEFDESDQIRHAIENGLIIDKSEDTKENEDTDKQESPRTRKKSSGAVQQNKSSDNKSKER